jgi:hypothetical protein
MQQTSALQGSRASDSNRTGTSTDLENSPETPEQPINGWSARAAQLCWYHQGMNAWLTSTTSLTTSSDEWTGWSATTVAEVSVVSWQPWSAIRDATEAPFVRWFCDAMTSAAFNEIDRAVLLGRGREPSFVAE